MDESALSAGDHAYIEGDLDKWTVDNPPSRLSTSYTIRKLQNATVPSELAVLTGNDYGILTMAFSKDGRTLVAAGAGDSVWSWDVSAYGLSR